MYFRIARIAFAAWLSWNCASATADATIKIAVSVGPGHTALSRIPLPTSSRASVFVSAITPPLHAE